VELVSQPRQRSRGRAPLARIAASLLSQLVAASRSYVPIKRQDRTLTEKLIPGYASLLAAPNCSA